MCLCCWQTALSDDQMHVFGAYPHRLSGLALLRVGSGTLCSTPYSCHTEIVECRYFANISLIFLQSTHGPCFIFQLFEIDQRISSKHLRANTWHNLPFISIKNSYINISPISSLLQSIVTTLVLALLPYGTESIQGITSK